MSDTRNVKLGPCRIFYGGVDLGYTQGGVEVTVMTDVHDVNVDQFGKTNIDSLIQGRNVMAKVPMAETTLENLVQIMPGAQLVTTGGIQATETITVSALPVALDTLTVGTAVFTFRTGATTNDADIVVGATVGATAANIAAALSSYDDPTVESMTYAANGAVVTATAVRYGSSQNGLVPFAKSSAGLTLSGAALAGGVDGSVRVDVPTAVGTSMLAIAKQLVLHPQNLAATDQSMDFVIPRASTAGAIQFTYKTDAERLFPVEFKGYPDPTTNRLFFVGPGN